MADTNIITPPATEAAPAFGAKEAHAWLLHNVTLPSFFQKLAELGHPQPQSQEEYDAYVDIAHKVATLKQMNGLQGAAQATNLLKSASSRLDDMLSKCGIQSGEAQQEAWIKQSAAQVAADPNAQIAIDAWTNGLQELMAAA